MLVTELECFHSCIFYKRGVGESRDKKERQGEGGMEKEVDIDNKRNTKSSIYVVALTPAVLKMANVPYVHQLLETDPDLAARFYKYVAMRISILFFSNYLLFQYIQTCICIF